MNEIITLPNEESLKKYWQEQRLDLVAHFDPVTEKLDQLDITQDGNILCIYRMSRKYTNKVDKYVMPDGVHSMSDLRPRPSDIEHFAYTLFMENLFRTAHPNVDSFTSKFCTFPE